MLRAEWLAQFRQALLTLGYAPDLIDQVATDMRFEELSEGFADRPTEAAQYLHDNLGRVNRVLGISFDANVRHVGVVLVVVGCVALAMALLLFWKFPNNGAAIFLLVVLVGICASLGFSCLRRPRAARRAEKR